MKETNFPAWTTATLQLVTAANAEPVSALSAGGVKTGSDTIAGFIGFQCDGLAVDLLETNDISTQHRDVPRTEDISTLYITILVRVAELIQLPSLRQ